MKSYKVGNRLIWSAYRGFGFKFWEKCREFFLGDNWSLKKDAVLVSICATLGMLGVALAHYLFY